MKNLEIILCLLILSIAFSSCEKIEPGFSGPGKVPVYLPFEELKDIKNIEPQEIVETGSIFLLNDFFFMLEQGKGIHVFDIADEEQVTPLTFIKVPASSDFTVDGNFLYVASWKDMLTLDVSDIYAVELVNRQEGVFTLSSFPRLFFGPFECVDESKGALISWEDAEVTNVLCNTI